MAEQAPVHTSDYWEQREFFAPQFEVERLGTLQTDGLLPGADLLVILRRK